jgi:hypothetical protein
LFVVLLTLNPALFLKSPSLGFTLTALFLPLPPLLLAVAIVDATLLVVLPSLSLKLTLLFKGAALLFPLGSRPIPLPLLVRSATLLFSPSSLFLFNPALLFSALVVLLAASLQFFIAALFLRLPLRLPLGLVVLTPLFPLATLFGSLLFLLLS